MENHKVTIRSLTFEKMVELTIYGENSGGSIIIKDDAVENGEAPVQLKEGNFYEYKIDEGFSLRSSEVVSQSRVNPSSGRITPNIYVGTLSIDILNTSTQEKCGEVKLEVQSVKASYREDYRLMLGEIAEKCTDLLLQHSSPVSNYFQVDFKADANTLYQRFAFIQSVIDSAEFNEAVHKVIVAPVTRWREAETTKDIRNVRRFHSSTIKQLASATSRVALPKNNPLSKVINSVPSKLIVNHKTETVDTPENRFIKHALASFQSFCNDFKTKANNSKRIKLEATLLEEKLEQYFSHSIFKEISTPTTLPLNSPVLQRKEGYREIFRAWLMFDLAAKLIWKGGDDVYSGNKRDVAVLYEYWLFFKLLEIIRDVFRIDALSTENLMEETTDGLGLKLKQGKYLPVKGIYESDTRRLNVEFSYNRTFNGDKKYPAGGSWTSNLRPDYTLSIWPIGVEQEQAEKEELMVHIHFDAKYKVENLQTIFGKEENLDDEEQEQKKGTYKRADLLKMHAYKDAIRRTAGAYILYPGSEKAYTRCGFHELIPGLGAFSIRPTKENSGAENLRRFLLDIVDHLMNRASQREKMSVKTYQVYKEDVKNELNESLPETYGENRELIPDETYILVGYSTSDERLDWYRKTKKYAFRMENRSGSLELSNEVVSSKYLLIRKQGENEASDLFKIVSQGPKVFSKEQMDRLGYPFSSNPKEYYLIIEIESVSSKEFQNRKWNFKELDAYKKILIITNDPYKRAGLPFTVTLTELMKVVKH